MRESYGFPLTVAAKSDVGRVRSNNEDSHGHSWLDDGSLFAIVADGMGGHEAGEVASGLAVRVVEELVTDRATSDPREVLFEALLEANREILDEGSRSGTRGMGTTAVAAVLRGSEVYLATIGDSRCYHIRHGHSIWRTRDHTRVQMLVDSGEILESEARSHPEAGMLTRALGHDRMSDGRALEPDVLPDPLHLEDQDALVLCSDGLHDLVEDWEIAELVAGCEPEDAADKLVAEACRRGGHDNITVTIIVAGPRAGVHDPAYVPEGHPDPADEMTVSAPMASFEDESGLPAPAPASRAAPAPGPATPVMATTGVLSAADLARARGEAPPKDRTALYVGLALGVVVMGVGFLGVLVVAAFLLLR